MKKHYVYMLMVKLMCELSYQALKVNVKSASNPIAPKWVKTTINWICILILDLHNLNQTSGIHGTKHDPDPDPPNPIKVINLM